MTARAIDLLDWKRDLDAQVRPQLDGIHPAGAVTLHDGLLTSETLTTRLRWRAFPG